jgi:hypothetical protein
MKIRTCTGGQYADQTETVITSTALERAEE